MVSRGEMGQILRFVGKHWDGVSRDPENRAMRGLPDDFWMNSLGGKAGKGFWVTAIMYTEDQRFADTFKDVLMKWQSKGMEKTRPPDLIQINKKGIDN